MIATESAFLQMGASVVSVFEAHTEVWTGKLPIENDYQDFKLLYDKVPALLSLQELSVEGFTEQKNNTRALVVQYAKKFANGIAYHGAAHNQPEIAKRFTVSPTEIEKKGDKELWSFAEGLLSATNALGTAARDAVGLTATTITTFTAHYTTFRSMVGNPKHKIEEAQRGTIQLKELIKDMRELLENRLDRAVTMIETGEPDFAIEYRGVREIVDPGYNTRALTVNIKEEGSNSPISSVEAIINPGNHSKLSTANGSFQISSLAGGTYTMVLSHANYIGKQVSFNIIANEPTVVDVQLNLAATQGGGGSGS